ncbi:MAG: hypothetical protein PF904_08895 [Kiritimatiellae bacterium]|jgi:hypothetical protein|nr:hypothetical protein [Kiritimatiellia bacterium]
MEIFKSIKHSVKTDDFAEPGAFNKWLTGAIVIAVAFCLVGLVLVFSVEGCKKRATRAKDDKKALSNKVAEADESVVDLFNPVRPAPASFPPDSNMPHGKESKNSGPIDLKTFDPQIDLVRFEDPRVWFESDHDKGDVEDDHMINCAVEIPLKRLVNLVEKKHGKLKVQEGYRAVNSKKIIHLEKSLHREGRAVDLTSEGFSLSELAKLCWQAGFDFVLYEVPPRGGQHLHCSMKRIKKSEVREF